MSDAPDNLVLVYLRRLDEKVDRLAADFEDFKLRLTLVERQQGQSLVNEQTHYASMSDRLDRIGARLDRIERRLDLVGEAAR